jgi:hypothetical protein
MCVHAGRRYDLASTQRRNDGRPTPTAGDREPTRPMPPAIEPAADHRRVRCSDSRLPSTYQA